MTFQPGANVYTQGFGSRPENVEVPHLDVRAPTTTDILYPVGKVWVDQVNNASYTLTSFSTSGNVTTANWVTTGGGSGAVATLTGDSGTATPSGGNIKIAGTANQIVTSASGSTVTLALTGPYTPATYTAHGVLVGEGTGSIVATAVGATNSVLQGTTGADPSFTTTPSVVSLTATTGNITATSGNIVASNGSVQAQTTVTAGTSITATNGNITATNGNLVLGTAGNKLVSTSVASTTTAGANSFGTVALASGTATVATTAVTANSLIFLTCQALGTVVAPSALCVSAKTASTSFVITASQVTDTSTIAWFIVN